MTEHQWLDLICESPQDWHLRLVAADWYEEHGDQDRADCLRWMARYRKCAVGSNDNEPSFAWYDQARHSWPGWSSELPALLWQAIAAESHIPLIGWHRKCFPDRRATEEALYQAWPVAIANGFNPQEEPVR